MSRHYPRVQIHGPPASEPPERLPGTAQLLVAGGDARIALDPSSGLNQYGCPVLPDDDLLAFGSATASVISAAGFFCADRLRQRLLTAIENASEAEVYAREIERLRLELRQLCELPDAAEIIFSPSGTELHAVVAQLSGKDAGRPPLTVMMAADETGSGVAAALAGMDVAADAAKPEPQAALRSGRRPNEVVAVPLRLSDGMPRPLADIDLDVSALAGNAVAAGRRVLLILIDQSKTGLIAPSPDCVITLYRRFQGNIDVMVDACQFRMAPPTLRAYLQQGFMVALTGSKFLAAPSFSGALLLPAQVAQRLYQRPFPRALARVSARADWPPSWPIAEHFAQATNFGLLLRWEVALQALRNLRAIPQTGLIDLLENFALTMQQQLSNDPCFETLPVRPLDRHRLSASESWDHLQTIFPFLLYHRISDAGRKPLNREQTLRIYRQLPFDLTTDAAFVYEQSRHPVAALRCQIGQPVACGTRGGVAVSALRLCLSSRLLVEAIAKGDNGTALIESALAVLNKIALLTRLQLT